MGNVPSVSLDLDKPDPVTALNSGDDASYDIHFVEIGTIKVMRLPLMTTDADAMTATGTDGLTCSSGREIRGQRDGRINRPARREYSLRRCDALRGAFYRP
ncbi:hypothetical protein EVAR_83399_1 [Eumeta japonica]|uniref:Uncharacterized protein n=1 Tax=Eumeta variegata TaxID=151549 RepID=A0A4C1TZQ3_EUMVA|nr:hypothetical protein EVAR_83399_1 [Eumeta japonica]